MLDTTGNTAVTYGQGKYIASSSSEYNYPNSAQYASYNAFDKNTGGSTWACLALYSAGAYTGTVVTTDTLGTAYAGEWIQLQMPVSVLLSSFTSTNIVLYGPTLFWILGSRDGTNWTLVYKYSGTGFTTQTFTVSATQSYNYYRFVAGAFTVGYTNTNMYELVFNGTEESLCVTNDAKVGVGIANPQRALEVAGDLVVSGTISGGAGLGSFRNRIINGDMRIAQRGTSNVVGVGQSNYMIDRFFVSTYNSGTLILTQTKQTLVASDTPYQLGLKYSLRVASVNGGVINVNSGLLHGIEGQMGIIDLNWGTSFGVPVTLSLWVRTNAVTGTVVCGRLTNGAFNYSYNFQYTATSTSGQWQYVTFTIPPPPNGSSWTIDSTAGIYLYLWGHQPGGGAGLTSSPYTWLAGNYAGTYAAAATPWWQNAGNYVEFTGVQLEKGTVATPWEQRPFATELALCQRYYYQWSSAVSGNYGTFDFCVQNGSNQVHFIAKYPVTMRSNVSSASNFTSSALSTFAFNSGGGAPGTLNSIAFDSAASTPYTGRFYITTGSAGTAGSSIELRANGTTSAFFGFSAEL
jgi:hypothetical protein